jgi:hypothetical protein
MPPPKQYPIHQRMPLSNAYLLVKNAIADTTLGSLQEFRLELNLARSDVVDNSLDDFECFESIRTAIDHKEYESYR